MRSDAVSRVMDILTRFLVKPSWSATELAREMEVNRTTIYRVVSGLVHGGFLVQDPATKHFQLGPTILQLGFAAYNRIDLRSVARPSLESLTQQTGDTALLWIRNGTLGVCIDKVDGTGNIILRSEIGVQQPLYAGASGKSLLAFSPETLWEQVIDEGLAPLAPNTIVDPATLREDLQKIRVAGYVYSREEATAGVAGVAAPVIDGTGKLAGSVSLVGPTFHITQERVPELIAAVSQAAAEISARLGDLSPRQATARSASSDKRSRARTIGGN